VRLTHGNKRLVTYLLTYLLIEGPKNEETSHLRGTPKSRTRGAETPEPIATTFCLPGAVNQIITHANLGEDHFRGFGVARGRILAFSIDMHCRLYHTFALPCECVTKKSH